MPELVTGEGPQGVLCLGPTVEEAGGGPRAVVGLGAGREVGWGGAPPQVTALVKGWEGSCLIILSGGGGEMPGTPYLALPGLASSCCLVVPDPVEPNMEPPASAGPPLKKDPVEESTGSTIPPPKKDPAPVAPPPNMLKSPSPSPILEASEDLVGEGPKLKKLILRPMSIVTISCRSESSKY